MTDKRGAGVYGRQSHGKETSVESQLELGEKRCELLGRPVVGVYRDWVSVSRFKRGERTDWPRLVSEVESGILGLLWLWDISRGDRTPKSWFGFLDTCREQRVELYSERDERSYRPWIPRDWKILADAGVDAAYESEIKSADVQRGITDAAKLGRPHGPVRDGYTRVYDARDRSKFKDVPNERAPIMREIILRVGRRDPVSHIQNDLTERGIPAPSWRGVPWIVDPWSRNTIRVIAQNPAYAGLRRHGGEIYTGNWEGVVTREEWEEAYAVLSEPERRWSQPGSIKYLLSYLMVGPHGPIQGTPAKPPRRDHYRCLKDACTAIGRAAADEYVTRVVLARLSRADAKDLFGANKGELAEARRRVAAIEEEAKELEAEVVTGRIRPALAAAVDAAIQERLAEAQMQARALSGNAAAMSLIGEEKFTSETARPRWDALSLAAQRSIIKLLIERVELGPRTHQVNRWTTEAQRLRWASEQIQITWRGPA